MNYSYDQNLKEETLVMGKMTWEEEQQLVNKNLAIWQYCQDFWRPAVELGERSYERLFGNFFSEAEKAEMKLQDKVPIEIAEGMPKLQAMVGLMELSKKDGVILPQDGVDAPPAEAVNIILKSIERQTSLKSMETDAFKAGIISGTPQLIFFDQPKDPLSDRTLDINLENWKAVYVDPNFRRQDLHDCDYVVRVRLANKEQCLAIAPERAKEIENEFSALPMLGNSGYGSSSTSEDRPEMFEWKAKASDLYIRTGRVYIIERQHLIRTKVNLMVSPDSEEAEVIPSTWEPERVQAWMQAHPTYQPIELPAKVLWVTTCTASGLLLNHLPHWYQEGEFACECYVPQFINEKPTGWFQFANANLKVGAIAKTEHIHSIRLATNGPVAIQHGTLENEQDVTYELTRPDGRIITKRGISAAEAIQPIQRNNAKQDWELLYTESMLTNDRLLVDRNVEGGAQSSQESAKVVQARVSQTLNKQAVYLQNFHQFLLRNRRKVLKMLSYVMTEPQVIRYIGDDGQAQEVEVNQPEMDWSGTATKIVNNLNGARYDYVEGETDTSVTGKMNELMAFQDLMQAGAAVPPELWPAFVASLPNAIAQNLAKKIQEQQAKQAESQGPPPPKVSVSLNPKDAPFNAAWFETMKQLTGVDVAGALKQSGQPVEQPPPEAPVPAGEEAPIPGEPIEGAIE